MGNVRVPVLLVLTVALSFVLALVMRRSAAPHQPADTLAVWG